MWVQTSRFSLGFCTVLLLDVWNTPTISDSKGPEVLLFCLMPLLSCLYIFKLGLKSISIFDEKKKLTLRVFC